MLKKLRFLFLEVVFFKLSTGFALALNPYEGCKEFEEVNTALGCIPLDFTKFVQWLLPILFSISGGVAFLLMVYGFILIGTSSGDEKKVQGAKETITSAVIGLIISISALFILKLIAIDILKIPGLS